jgi:hypothetical protein
MHAVAWWPHTSNAHVASVRLRCLQIVTELQRQGIHATVYRPGQEAPRILVLSKRYDEKSVRHAVTMQKSRGTRLVLDLCDNHFYSSGAGQKWRARADSLRDAVAAVDLVIVSTQTLAQRVKDECAHHPPLAVIGDAVEEPFSPGLLQRAGSPWAELQFFRLRHSLLQDKIPEGRRLLWFGNHGSGNAEGGMEDLLLIREKLESAFARAPLSLTVISNNAEKYRKITQNWSLKTYYLDWHLTTFSRAAALHDIAVIPVGLNPFTVCKTNNRVATAHVHGLAVVANSIPSYTEFSNSAILDDWEHGLTMLMESHAVRMARVENGIELIKSRWSLTHIVAEWARVLELQR